MPEVVLQATPRVFGNKRLDKSPRLLLVFHIGVNPAQCWWAFKITSQRYSNKSDKKKRIKRQVNTGVYTCAWSCLWCSIDSECRSSRGKEHHACRLLNPPSSNDPPWIPYTASKEKSGCNQHTQDANTEYTASFINTERAGWPGFLLQWKIYPLVGWWWWWCNLKFSSWSQRLPSAKTYRLHLQGSKYISVTKAKIIRSRNNYSAIRWTLIPSSFFMSLTRFMFKSEYEYIFLLKYKVKKFSALREYFFSFFNDKITR